MGLILPPSLSWTKKTWWGWKIFQCHMKLKSLLQRAMILTWYTIIFFYYFQLNLDHVLITPIMIFVWKSGFSVMRNLVIAFSVEYLINLSTIYWVWNYLYVDSHIVAENTKYLWPIHNLCITNKLSLQLEALSNYDNFIVITISYNSDVLHGITKITINIK